MLDYYELLGVARNASSASIRSGFRSASLRSHPDKGGTSESFAQVQTAYKTLSNADLRRAYDETIGARGAGCSEGVRAASSSYGFEYARGGVHVLVHGQTQRRPDGSSKKGARAGQRSDDAGQLTSEIERRHREMVARPGDRDLIERLAAAHLDRGEYHLSTGRRSHASFDAHEVELLRPEKAETRHRHQNLLRALEHEPDDRDDDDGLDDDRGDDDGLDDDRGDDDGLDDDRDDDDGLDDDDDDMDVDDFEFSPPRAARLHDT